MRRGPATRTRRIVRVDTELRNSFAAQWDIPVLSPERSLDLDGALDRIHDTGKFGKNAVASGVDDASVTLLDERID